MAVAEFQPVAVLSRILNLTAGFFRPKVLPCRATDTTIISGPAGSGAWSVSWLIERTSFRNCKPKRRP